MVKKLVTLLLLLDFSKAFDSVYHVRLLKKLLDYGFSKVVIRWIASYLTGREQAVSDNNENCSSYLKLNTGIPQGSMLGPLLCALYVNDISLCLDLNVSHLMYADDLQMYIRCASEGLDSMTNKMSANAGRIMSWATQNHLRLNVGKTKAIVIGTPYYINRLSSVARSYVDIGGVKGIYESSLRILAVVLDSKEAFVERTHCTSEPSYMRRFTSTVPARDARAPNRAISNSCL